MTNDEQLFPSAKVSPRDCSCLKANWCKAHGNLNRNSKKKNNLNQFEREFLKTNFVNLNLSKFQNSCIYTVRLCGVSRVSLSRVESVFCLVGWTVAGSCHMFPLCRERNALNGAAT
jgi:hypothetical protein